MNKLPGKMQRLPVKLQKVIKATLGFIWFLMTLFWAGAVFACVVGVIYNFGGGSTVKGVFCILALPVCFALSSWCWYTIDDIDDIKIGGK